MSSRNVLVESSVSRTLKRVDDFTGGETVALPSAAHRRACEDLIAGQRASVRTAALFLMNYWVEAPEWDLETLPVGIRGTFGDKPLSEGLTLRGVTLHDAITAFAENLGWKGNVRNVRLSNDPRFRDFLRSVADARGRERARIADFLAQQFASSRKLVEPLPPLGADVLTFARAKVLFHRVLGMNAEGHVQQFLIAALLFVYRRRGGNDVTTHHPHAADRYDGTAGDIEESRGSVLVRAYEVTVRDDWKNRLSTYRRKMDDFGLAKYIIVAGGVNSDAELSVPAGMALKLEVYGRDIAIIDIHDVVNFLAAELTPVELREAVNKVFEYLSNPKLSGRAQFKADYRGVVRDWLDEIGDAHGGPDGAETQGDTR